jgi:hypothetical protein
VDNAHPLDLILASYAPGQSVTLTIERDSAYSTAPHTAHWSTLTVTLTFGTRPASI